MRLGMMTFPGDLTVAGVIGRPPGTGQNIEWPIEWFSADL